MKNPNINHREIMTEKEQKQLREKIERKEKERDEERRKKK
jgi:hypothetical protein